MVVITRSGKNPKNPGFLNGKPNHCKVKASTTNFQIFDDHLEIGGKHKETTPCNEIPPIKKAKGLNLQYFNKENDTNIINQIKGNESFQSCEFKKIIITEDEKLMNGAPEGDLFDMIVLEDQDLHRFNSIDDAKTEFLRICTTVTPDKTITWADNYEKVVVIRRITVYHANEIFNCDLVAISQALSYVIEAIMSLRSCMIRNGILCLKAMILNCANSLSDNYENCYSVISTLLLKTGGGPRFIVDLSYETLSVIATTMIKPFVLTQCMVSFMKHRNADIASNAVSITVDSIKKHNIRVEAIEDQEYQQNILIILSSGINAKRSKAKDSAKNALKQIYDSMNLSDNSINTTISFQQLITNHLHDNYLYNEILKIVMLPTTSSTSTTPATSTIAASPFVLATTTATTMNLSLSSVMKQQQRHHLIETSSKHIRNTDVSSNWTAVDTKNQSTIADINLNTVEAVTVTHSVKKNTSIYNNNNNNNNNNNSNNNNNNNNSNVNSSSTPLTHNNQEIINMPPFIPTQPSTNNTNTILKRTPLTHQTKPATTTTDTTITVNNIRGITATSSGGGSSSSISMREHILLMKQKHKQQQQQQPIEVFTTVGDNNNISSNINNNNDNINNNNNNKNNSNNYNHNDNNNNKDN